jgi:hypothetical protein
MVDLMSQMAEMRSNIKENTVTKWHSNRPRVRPFIPPFERYAYKDFIWKAAFANGILLSPLPEELKVKVYVGRGNNSQLVRSLLKRRGWWVFTEKWEEANLVWTQLKINAYFALQL